MTTEKRSERALFFSLWTVLILGAAIWYFYPSSRPTARDGSPEVTIAPEMKSWFSEARLALFEPPRYTVRLTPTPQYLKTLKGEKRTIHLSYRLVSKDNNAQSGLVACVVDPEKPAVSIVISHPQPFQAKAIVIGAP